MKTATKLFASCALLGVVGAALAAPFQSTKGYQITGPTGWKLNKSGFLGTDVFFLAPAKNNYSANINVVVSPVPPGTKLETLRAQTVATMPKMLNDFKMGAVGYGAVAGTRALRLSGTYTLGTPPRRLQLSQYSAIRGNQMFVFTHTALAGQNSTEPAFKKALASVKWKK